jgi:hypothetical protein
MKERHTADGMIERIIRKFFTHFVEIMSKMVFVFQILPVGAKLYSVTSVHQYISVSVSVTAESTRTQHSLGCKVSNVFLKYAVLFYEHRDFRPMVFTVFYTRLMPPVQ